MDQRTLHAEEHEVLRLAHKYAYAVDSGDSSILEQIFTLDAHWFFKGRPDVKCYDEIVQIPARLKENFVATHHAIQTQHVELTGSEGRGVTYCIAYHMFSRDFVDPGRDPIQVAHNYVLRYHDRYRREDGIWRFCERQLDIIFRRVDHVAALPESSTLDIRA